MGNCVLAKTTVCEWMQPWNDYGSAKYRLGLDDKLVLMWLCHMCELAREASAREGRTATITHH